VSGYEDRLDSYVDVATRLAEFREKHPEGALQPVNLAKPYHIEVIGDRVFVVYAAAAYRTPDDQRPGVGVAWEPFPGRTPYTKDSELMNAETSAQGRAIVAALAADTKRGIATREEVRNRQAAGEREPVQPVQASSESVVAYTEFLMQIRSADRSAAVGELGTKVSAALNEDRITEGQYKALSREAAKKLQDLEKK
jgi:hypothetical protein